MFNEFAGTTVFAICIVGVVILFLLSIAIRSVRVLTEYERGVIFTLGKFTGVRGPGLTFLIPILQNMRKVDMRLATAEVPRQEVMTKDNIPCWSMRWSI